MRYQIHGAPLPVVVMELEPGESINTQVGAMGWMTPNLKMATNTGGGIGKAFTRGITGESIFQNTYTAEGGKGILACPSKFPGDILAIQVSGGSSIIAQKSAFLACESGVSMSIFFQKNVGAGFFGGEGFIMQKFSGKGTVFLEIDGSVVKYTLDPGESLMIDNGYLAAMDETVSIDVEMVRGFKNMVLGGEGLTNTRVTGPGNVWLQTMPISQVAASLKPFFPSSNR